MLPSFRHNWQTRNCHNGCLEHASATRPVPTITKAAPSVTCLPAQVLDGLVLGDDTLTVPSQYNTPSKLSPPLAPPTLCPTSLLLLPAQVLDGLVVEDDTVVAHDAVVAVRVVGVKRNISVDLQQGRQAGCH